MQDVRGSEQDRGSVQDPRYCVRNARVVVQRQAGKERGQGAEEQGRAGIIKRHRPRPGCRTCEAYPADQVHADAQDDHDDEEGTPADKAADEPPGPDAGGGAEEGGRGDPRLPDRPARPGDGCGDEHRAAGDEHCGSEGLQDPGHNQGQDVPCEEAEERPDRKEESALKEGAFQAAGIRKPPDDDAKAGKDEHVPVQHPGDHSQRRIELLHDEGKGNVDAAHCRRSHESTECDDKYAEPVVLCRGHGRSLYGAGKDRVQRSSMVGVLAYSSLNVPVGRCNAPGRSPAAPGPGIPCFHSYRSWSGPSRTF